MATATETLEIGRATEAPTKPLITVTEKAAEEVKRHIAGVVADGTEPDAKYYLRVSVQGAGCSGFKDKLDLDTKYDEKRDHKFEYHGIEVVIDKRSALYLEGAVVDFHDDLNKRGFTVKNPNAKTTCGCGSSYSM